MADIYDVLRRGMTRQNKLGALLAVLTCPCHIVALGFLLTGTAVGTWFLAARAYLMGAFSLLFLIGLWLMMRPDPTCRLD
jgi:MerE protein